jgi:hypothetical protein
MFNKEKCGALSDVFEVDPFAAANYVSNVIFVDKQ